MHNWIAHTIIDNRTNTTGCIINAKQDRTLNYRQSKQNSMRRIINAKRDKAYNIDSRTNTTGCIINAKQDRAFDYKQSEKIPHDALTIKNRTGHTLIDNRTF